jgi:hypothetical protein
MVEGVDGAENKRRGYNDYLQGQYFRERRDREDLSRSVGYYEQAIKSDPGYALAWAGLSVARMFQATIGYLPFDEGCRKAREAAERALALDANLAESNAAVGNVKFLCDWDWASAHAWTSPILKQTRRST